MCQAEKNLNWVTRLIKELHFDKVVKLSIKFCENNIETLKLIKNPKQHKCSKHIDVQYYYICKIVANGYAVTKYVPTAEIIADILTKPLLAKTFAKLQE